MKKQEREVYVTLSTEIDWPLCPFCRYQFCEGNPCEDMTSECRHPIEDLAENKNSHDMEAGDDCWGFKPALPVRTVADIVGVFLAENLDSGMTMYYRGEKPIRVMGLKLGSPYPE